MDELARPFAGDRAFEVERARAWHSIAYAHIDPVAREQAARHVDELARPFAGDRAFEVGRVGGWQSVAYGYRHNTVACEQAARRVDDLARPFAGDRNFELERVEARGYIRPAPAPPRGIGQLPRL